ncbi:helix-turn-helix domain-containing protein [Nonomuraea sp. NPDC049152]|uniref:ArsR/SmtB family transcription factor n=1 Tax=Nonomuraea sp. NPDC049152 TaxID=3154350 RepID=UPI0033DF4880
MEETRRHHLGPGEVGTLKALSHPTRVRLLLAVSEIGPATVGMLAERVGEAVGGVSYHLQQLAKYGLVAEVPELARDKRERWWRFAHVSGLSMAASEFADDPVGQLTQRAALLAWTEATAERMRQAVETMHTLPQEWWNATQPGMRGPLRLTAEELGQLCDELGAVIDRWLQHSKSAADQEGRWRVHLPIHPLVSPEHPHGDESS